MDRKKELKEMYKQIKPQMGLVIVRSKNNDKFLTEATKNLKGKINSMKFQLKAGVHTNKKLQAEWNIKGKDEFIIEILDYLEYDKDERKTDYREDLKLLKSIYEEKMLK